MSTTQDIRRAFEKRLKAASISGLNTASDIAWENTDFNPSGKTAWLSVKLVVDESPAAAIGAGNAERWSGTFLITCFVKQNTGTAALDQLADAVKALFPYGLQVAENGKIINVRQSKRASDALQDAPWYYVPVTVAWYCYA